MYKQFGINEEVIELAHKTEEQVKEQFKKIEEVCEYNSLKILSAFQKYNLSEMHFNSTTGYGYSDVGRETIEKIFAEVLNTEDSLVRGQFISGTHALTVALFAFLRPNDIFLSIIFGAKLIDEKLDYNLNEILDVKWFSYDEIIKMKNKLRSPELILKCIENYKTGKIVNLDVLNIL